MNGREDGSRPILERPHVDPIDSRLCEVTLSSLEQILGREVTVALCFHISTQSGRSVNRLLIENPEAFRRTMISILQADVDMLLDRVAHSLCEEFGLDERQRSFVGVIRELRKKR